MLPHQHVVVIGGGTMGTDIAAIFAAGGYAVDIVQRPGKTRESLGRRLAASVEQLGGGSGAVVEYDEPSQLPWDQVGLVIESINEELTAKQQLFAKLEALAPAAIPITSNSSSFPISQIAAGLKTSRRMLGLHFFMPAHLVPLVEVVLSESTDPAVAESVAALMAKLGRKTVTVKRDIPGFLANRLQHALMREAWSLIDRGIATPEDVDTAVRFGFGFRYVAAGPVMQKEHSGLDVTLAASTMVFPDLCNDPVPAKVLRDKVAAGHHGMKTGRGFYQWSTNAIAAARSQYAVALRKGLEALNIDKEASVMGDDFAGVTEARAVWDFSTGDGKLFLERVRLIDNALTLFADRGIAAEFVVTLRGLVLQFVAQDVARTSFAGADIDPEHLDKIQTELEALTRRGVKVEACLYSMRKRGVEPDNVLPFVALEENVFANAIALQSKGYAFMRVD